MSDYKYTVEVCTLLKELGGRIHTARVRRRWSQAELAGRMGVNRSTVVRLEEGSPGISMGVFLMALWVMGLMDSIADTVRPEDDKAGLFLEQKRQPLRVRQKKRDELNF